MRFVLREEDGTYFAGFGTDYDAHDVAKYTHDVNAALVLTLSYANGVFVVTPNIPVIQRNTLCPIALKLVAVE